MRLVKSVSSFVLALGLSGSLFAAKVKMQSTSIQGENADKMIQILQNLGVEDTDQMEGVKKYRAELIDCDEIRYRISNSECSVMFNDQIVEASKEEANELTHIFYMANAQMGRDFTGHIPFRIRNIVCTTPVVMKPISHCEFDYRP